jgi:hypothetical protein
MPYITPSLAAASPAAAGFQPLAPLLQSITHTKLDAARLRVAEFDRDKLIKSYRNALTSNKRLTAFILADEMTKRGIPPCSRLDHRSPQPATPEQKFDLLMADLRWLRRWYPDHVNNIRYKRYRDLYALHEPAHHRSAEYVFYGGKRPAWKIVASMSLDQRQQWDCVVLRSAPIKKHGGKTQAMSDRVFSALRDDLQSVRRTSSFTDEVAHATLIRRHKLWLCSRMTSGSPTETAIRYSQMTGLPITRQNAAKQLQKIAEALVKMGVTMKGEKRARMV